ncbi:transporter substrate-binding domain-containing protein [Vibrio parahaemolyticus]|uniref:transporter substrate-binding domain-containing protein n=1 Tax=Vibrio parahaemolyticus TaxID=670 RepID=UPI00111DF1B2|nr:transporter substrate-binding domain-containing protein [Vibrio parahaemolyticus]EGQ8541403.1 transporter substrate-binding domain-containing protein [Vibrio parahaemolyticus]EIJ2221615.1 transporter substrate-binding domain-containing protein [Vibrio parahaemolyticus]EJG1009813.1 transporter substrate-binding domain-containing protein [Vibrio parahaemolyticus]EJG1840181.1 transporter substrate-binding domain-containing protein [Vibrio parahaemolyticus]EKA8932387.1 transporter substrate-bin
MLNKKSVLQGALALSVLLPATMNVALANENSLTFGYIADEAPFSSLNQVTGQPDGYTIELCKAVAHSMGVNNSNVKFFPVTLESGLQKISTSDIDMLCSAVTPTAERRQLASFSLPVFQGGVSAVLHRDAPHDLKRVLEGKPAHEGPKWRATINRGLANHTYVVHAKTVTETWVKEQVKRLGVVANILTVDTHEQGLALVNSGEADAYFAEVDSLSNELTKGNFNNLELSGRVYETALQSIALPRNNDDFRLQVDKALSDTYNSAEFTKLYQRYFGHQQTEGIEAIKYFSLK